MTTNDGGPAFPCEYNMTTESGASRPCSPGYGISLRDYFAAAALQGLLACPNTYGDHAGLAGMAYQYADAMLAEREKGASNV